MIKNVSAVWETRVRSLGGEESDTAEQLTLPLSLGPGKSKIKASTDLVSSKSLLLSLQMAFFSLRPCSVEVVRELSGASFLVVLIL